MVDNVASSLIINSLTTATFPRHARLRNPQQFKETFSQGRRISDPLFRVHARLVLFAPEGKSARSDPSDESSACARLGIAVSKRVDAHAVGRNRIKRVVRESFRAMRARLPAGDYVVLAQHEAAHASNAQLVHALDMLWLRAITLSAAEPGAGKSDAAALKRGPAAITMPPRDMLASDPGCPPESP